MPDISRPVPEGYPSGQDLREMIKQVQTGKPEILDNMIETIEALGISFEEIAHRIRRQVSDVRDLSADAQHTMILGYLHGYLCGFFESFNAAGDYAALRNAKERRRTQAPHRYRSAASTPAEMDELDIEANRLADSEPDASA